jgi:hypothetical protein
MFESRIRGEGGSIRFISPVRVIKFGLRETKPGEHLTTSGMASIRES